VTDVAPESISFTFTANSLPWVVPDEAELGYRITDASHKMSRETIRITGLRPGWHLLRIDGKKVGVYGHSQFAAGLELQGNLRTPQYAQAMKVAILNRERNDRVIRPLRDR